jgi:hypothetical protein
VKPPSAIQPESAPSKHRPSDPPMKMKTPGAPFLARPLREKWGFSTEQVKRAEGAKPGRASLMRPALAHRFGSAVVAAPDSATLPGVKNRRKTCPKIISSANNATASEKIIPPTTAMNVIAICMMSPCSSLFGRTCLPVSIGQHSYQCKTGTRSYPTENKQVGLGRLGYESVSATTPCLSIHRFCSASGMRIEIKD